MPQSKIIRDVQQALKNSGQDVDVDGFDGPGTQAAYDKAGGLHGLRDYIEAPKPRAPGKHPWLEKAQEEIGVAEAENDERIVEYGMGATQDSSTPWCAAFLNWVLDQVGLRGTGSLRARDFAEWGEESEGGIGDIVVYPSHVGIVSGDGLVVGGNQSNKVCEGKLEWYGTPIAFRRPPAEETA